MVDAHRSTLALGEWLHFVTIEWQEEDRICWVRGNMLRNLLTVRCSTASNGSGKQHRRFHSQIRALIGSLVGEMALLASSPFAISSLLLPYKPHQSPAAAPQLSSQPTTLNCRPAVILPGLGNNTNDYGKLELTLKVYGVPTAVAKVSRIDWLRNAAGLIDPNYWRGTLNPRPVLDWYLRRVDEAVRDAKLLAEGGSISVIGHSAGGWLARVYMEEVGLSHISLLLTLGSPHMPPPKGLPGVIDQTRGLLDYVDNNCAKAVYTPKLKYVCIAGRYIQGARFFGPSDTDSSSMVPVENDQPTAEVAIINSSSRSTSIATSLRVRFIGQGYKQVCGQADVWGDGVVPEVSAHLEGALNLSLEGVYHSPVGSDDTLRPWYGSPAVVEKWIHHLLS